MVKKCLLALLLLSSSAPLLADDCVILLHGLARSAASMETLQRQLETDDYHVVNVDYPSREHPIATLTDMAIGEGLQACRHQKAQRISFVTHSLGGILVRYYLKQKSIPELHRVVMLGPPNQGSEVVDTLRDVPGFEAFNGPAGMQLGTSSTDIPRQLGPVDFELGVIAGTQSINLILSTYLPGTDDGKVTVENTRVKGMQDFIALSVTHPMMMKNPAVIKQILHFLKHGSFNHFSKKAS